MLKLLENIKKIVRKAAVIMLKASPEQSKAVTKDHSSSGTDDDARTQEMLFTQLADEVIAETRKV